MLAESVRAGDAAAVAAHLDALAPDARVEACRALDRRLQAGLYELCAGAAPITLDDLVPPGAASAVWEGRNSMPLFRPVHKPMARIDGAVIGYNIQPWDWLTGPGYFTVRAGDREPFFDYTTVPERGPEGWPRPRSNARGFSLLVYRNTWDYLRRVSDGVLISAATRLGRPIGVYFFIARR